MTKLEKLIEELCPNGVEYKTLGEIATIVRGASPRPIKKYVTNDENGVNWIKIGDVKQGSKYITETKEKITKEGALKSRFVKTGDFILSNSMSFGRPYILKIDGCIHDGWLSISNFEDYVITDYFYYTLMSTSIQNEMKQKASFGGAVQNLNADIVKSIKIPLPPLEVQAEIVKILDDYSTSVTALQQELEKELTARKKQYEYYRDVLLTFDDRIERKALNDVIISLNTGLNPRQFFKLNTDDAANYYITIREIRGGRIVPTDKTDLINDEALRLCNNRSNLEVGDILFSGTGTIGETAVIIDEPSNWNIKEGVYAIKPDSRFVLSKFLRYLLMTEPVKQAYMKKVAGGTVKSIPMGELKKIVLPIPSLEEQERIVQILDRFDKLCNDISEGLPAEIEARRKQYEYYRDKLLSFNVREC